MQCIISTIVIAFEINIYLSVYLSIYVSHGSKKISLDDKWTAVEDDNGRDGCMLSRVTVVM